MEWYKLSPDQAAAELGTDPAAGLTTEEAQARLQKFGPNELIERGAKEAWRILLDQFKEPMVIVLIVAAIVSAVLGEWIDVVVILAIVVLNAILGFTQEYRAEQAMAALKQMSVPTVRVRRNGRIAEISSKELVPGDVVILEAGNIVPADGRIWQSANLKAQEAALTGESEPVAKRVEAPKGDNLPLGDRRDMLFMGTTVTYGRGEMLVVATGMNTELGNIADMLQSVEGEQTPLQRRLAKLGTTLAWVSLVIVAIIVGLGLLQGEELETVFLTGVSMAVAVIPEGLPAVVTITLALGAQRLLKRNALIRKLPAVETLGSVTVICSDKTGTLTQNLMTVTMLDVAGNSEALETAVERRESLARARLVNPDAPPDLTALRLLVLTGVLCNDAVLEKDDAGRQVAIGDPTEGALVLAAHELGFNKALLEDETPRVAEVPFTSERKRMTTVHRLGDFVQQLEEPWTNATYACLTKGAVDSVLTITSHVYVNRQVVPLDDELRERIQATNARYAQQGQRVLGAAFRLWHDAALPEADEQLEMDMIFVGMVAIMDPPRPEARPAVATARAAGIRPVMITGDHPLTAHHIARELTIVENGRYLTGQELNQMTDTDLEAVVADVSVYARVAPEHKLNIVNALQRKGEIVAMTGDGVNDAPALKTADIGVAMGITGSDVSKEAADMVLLDDNFATIVAAVEQGRVIYDNIRKFIKYTLSSNVGELFVMLAGPFLGMPLPLLPLQILWVNLVTDGLPGVALAEEPGERGVMKRPPFHPQESVFSRGIGAQIIWVGVLLGLVSLAIGFIYWSSDPNGPWQTMVFTTLVLAQMGNALATRSSRDSTFTIGLLSNRLMVIAVTMGFLLQLILLYVPFFQGIFKTEPLTALDLLVALAASSVVFIIIELYKWVLRRREA